MDNFAQIPNDLLEALILYRLSGLRLAILLYIIRKTYGWHKDRDYISLKKMADDLGRDRREITRLVHDLEARGIIEREKSKPNQSALTRVLPPERWETDVTKMPQGVNDPMVKKSHDDVTKRSQGVWANGHSTMRPNGHTQNTYYIHSIKDNEIQGVFSSEDDDDDDLMTPEELAAKWGIKYEADL